MRPGKAMSETFTAGAADFKDGVQITMCVGGPGKLIDCLKCPKCGYSETK